MIALQALPAAGNSAVLVFLVLRVRSDSHTALSCTIKNIFKGVHALTVCVFSSDIHY